MPVYLQPKKPNSPASVHHITHYTQFAKNVNPFFIFLILWVALVETLVNLERAAQRNLKITLPGRTDANRKDLTNINKYVKIGFT